MKRVETFVELQEKKKKRLQWKYLIKTKERGGAKQSAINKERDNEDAIDLVSI